MVMNGFRPVDAGPSRLGFAPQAWNAAVEEVREFLVRLASDPAGRAFVTPAALAKNVNAIPFERGATHRLGPVLPSLLRDVDASEAAAGRPMLSALVRDEHRNRAGSFAPKARRLGRRGTDDEDIWLREAIAVRQFWAAIRLRSTNGQG